MADNKPAWQYKPEDNTATAVLDDDQLDDEPVIKKSHSGGSITWEASEYVQHSRGPGWYVLLFLATTAVTGLVYLISNHDLIATIVIPILGVAVAVYSTNKPKNMAYQLDSSGIKIGEKVYDYNHFKSFSIMHDGAVNSINFEPIKRFMVPFTVYYGPGDEEKILDILGQHLPYEDRQMDSIDRLTRRLRF